MATVTKKTVLITGCTTGGIGWAMAKVFHSRGYYVFATVRGGQASKAEGLTELGDVEILDLDVTDTDTISRAKDVVAKRTGGRLDVLMNNAGAEFVCPLLDTDIAEAKKLFDVNVWGPLAMVQAFAPLLVAAQGIISNHTSIASVLPLVWAGAYSAAKSAELRFSEILRCEMQPLGVRVVTAMVGSVDTPIFNKPGGKMQLPETSYYYRITEKAYQQRLDHQKESMQVGPFAEQLVADILDSNQPTVWRGTAAAMTKFALWAFPKWYLEKLCNGDRGLELVKKPST
ncbi:NADPH-dependent 1-acyldihydroxyacetone phosphate reductase [Rhypophila sp. PSN 637]